MLEEEQESFGVSHDTVGEKLLQKWLFPPNLAASVGHHHSPQNGADHQLFSVVTQVSDLLSHLFEDPSVTKDTDIATFITEHNPNLPQLWSGCGLGNDHTVFENYFSLLKANYEDNKIIMSFIS